MSGFVGIVHTDGKPVEPDVLTTVTARLTPRGPDAQRQWSAGHVGLGHTLFATTKEAWRERQPCSFDGRVWIVADARIDARDELKRRLTSRGRVDLTSATDVELILQAYYAWGDRCVEHLLGDFAFAIWDTRTRQLLCVRDHFGVKPFFYAYRGGVLAFSNTFSCVRSHPAVTNAIDERTIGDFLLFKYNMRPDHTGLEDVLRLAPGHLLTWSSSAGVTVKRYWSLAQPTELRYRRSADYIEHFRELFDAAVQDRLRTAQAAVALSGGMDSSMVAASAKAALVREGGAFELRAHTAVFDHAPDEERHYAGLVAQKIGLPIQFRGIDGFGGFDPPETTGYPSLAEPADTRFLQLQRQFRTDMIAGSRIALNGDDADALLNEHAYRHFSALLLTRRIGTMASAMLRYAMWLRRRPPLGLRAALNRLSGRSEAQELFPYPGWVNDEFAARVDLRERWREVMAGLRCRETTLRPRAMETIPNVWWRMFENEDFTSTGQCLESRWPFADRRVVEFLLSIPAVPWCMDKTISRRAAQGTLPDTIRHRRKTPLSFDPLIEKLRLPEARWLDEFDAAPALSQYVNRQKVPPVTGAFADSDCYLNLRPLWLNWWLTHGVGYATGEHYGQREHEQERSGIERVGIGPAKAGVLPACIA